MLISFRLNGAEITLDADHRAPLLLALRDLLGLRSARNNCSSARCGACTVHLDDKAIPSCRTPLHEVAGKSVLTIEGLSPDGNHPLQKAWLEPQIPQCGLCQDGQVMTAAALLKTKCNPTVAEIKAAFDGKICRCGTYTRILYAIRKVAGPPLS